MVDEYAVESAARSDKGGVQRLLNQMFEQGWEFVESYEGLDRDDLKLIFKKHHRTR